MDLRQKKNQSQMQMIKIYMKFILRYRPEDLGIELDQEGWTSISEFTRKLSKRFPTMDRAIIETIVANDEYGRFSIENEMIRVNSFPQSMDTLSRIV